MRTPRRRTETAQVEESLLSLRAAVVFLYMRCWHRVWLVGWRISQASRGRWHLLRASEHLQPRSRSPTRS